MTNFKKILLVAITVSATARINGMNGIEHMKNIMGEESFIEKIVLEGSPTINEFFHDDILILQTEKHREKALIELRKIDIRNGIYILDERITQDAQYIEYREYIIQNFISTLNRKAVQSEQMKLKELYKKYEQYIKRLQYELDIQDSINTNVQPEEYLPISQTIQNVQARQTEMRPHIEGMMPGSDTYFLISSEY